ncbi:MBL fold metallo-hydrolase [Roseibacillus persicicus]|uniref:Hydroxyacylglutathione hydrolase n=1 Tax=Roseibacillus persicicus TaxID=454148 RepID=A0A918TPC5_9BACT|nr:MBL fold metallo-hydrolase [Roseibacillus persicicus]GHC50868.1 hydroxyacylglutathione hydrolase [Roseibacillus persicicus]
MNLEQYTGGTVATNGYLLEDGGTTLLIDAPEGIFEWLEQKDLYPDHLLLTHQHFDHVEDASRFNCPIHAFAPFSRELTLDEQARAWGLPVSVGEFEVTGVLEGKRELTLGQFKFDLLHVPGHSPDSVVYSLPAHGLALSGDTIFNHGSGRTDLPGGDGPTLFDGIRTKLLTLPDETRLYPGHGPHTTPAAEKARFPLA